MCSQVSRDRAHRARVCLLILLVAGALFRASRVDAQPSILTNRYDPQRTGANLQEVALTTANVNARQFGRLYSLPVDGAVYAQPLYVPRLLVNGAIRNVLFVATMNDKLYAFDADTGAAPLWVRDFTRRPTVTPIPVADITTAGNIIGNVGIQGTPVIDPATQTLYVVVRTKEDGSYVQRLHAIDITTGTDRTGSPVTIQGTAEGGGPDVTSLGTVPFDPKLQLQRAGLALSHGVVLIAWASHEDLTPSHGWIMGYDAATLRQVAAMTTTPDGYLGGIWQGGRAPTIDADGNAYFVTGNGPWDGVRNFGDSVLKFSVASAGMQLIDYFTPANEASLNAADDDLSGSGFTLIPGTSLLVGGGKEGVLYALDTRWLGRKTANDAGAVQKLPVHGGHVMGGVTVWNSAATGTLVYNWSEEDVLRAYAVVDGRLNPTPYATGDVDSPGHPGGSLTVSANGSTAGTGIVWASMPLDRDAKHNLATGVLRAYDAATLQPLWNSEEVASRDRVGNLMKFVPPVVVNGRVYVPNHDGAVQVYGLLPPDFSLTATPAVQAVAPGVTATYRVTVTPQSLFANPVSLAVAGAPAGVTATISPASIPAAGGIATLTVTVAPTTTAIQAQLLITATDGIRSRSTAVSLLIGASLPAGTLGIVFVGSAPAMAAADRAGIVPQANWNNAIGKARTSPLPLVDAAGAATAATVTWTSGGIWQLPGTPVDGDGRLMKGYLDTPTATPTIVSVQGLAARTYDVYVYADGDNREFARSARYTLSVPGAPDVERSLTDLPNSNFSCAFVESTGMAGNYLKFAVTGPSFTLAAAPSSASSATLRAVVNAVQIVPTAPLPVTPLGAISVDFVGSGTSILAPTQTAGVVPRAHWNAARGASATTPLRLVDDAGGSTTVTATWSANNSWSVPAQLASPDAIMMTGYLDTSNTTSSTVAIAGLPDGVYDIYVYVDGDNRAYTRSGRYTVEVPGQTATQVDVADAAGTNFSGVFIDGSNGTGNYVKARVVGSSFTITAAPLATGTSTLRAPINGLQIVPAAAP